jgi:hypothetical protein
MNPMIMLIIAIVLFIGAIIREIDWKKHAINWVGNNPARGQIYVKAGDTLRTFEGKRDKNNESFYTWAEGKQIKSVSLPVDYPYEYIRGRRIIGVDDGQPVASPLGSMTADERRKCTLTDLELSVMVESKDVVLAMKTINQSRKMNWVMIVIIAGVVVFGLLYYQNNIAEKAVPVQSQNVTDRQQLPKIINENERVIP